MPRSSRVAYLNNHNTAAAFVVATMAKAGATTYIPTKCPENGAVSGQAALDLRTCHISQEDAGILDSVDLYSRELVVGPEFVDCLNRNFDVVVFPGSVRTANYLYIAEHARMPIVILEWGDIGGVTFHREYESVVANRSNVQYAVAQRALSPDHMHLPLGLAEDVSTLGNLIVPTWERPTFGLIASRLSDTSGWTYRQVAKFLRDPKAKNADLIILGKDHGVDQPFPEIERRWHGVRNATDLSKPELLGIIASLNATLYWMREKCVVQYSPLEAAAVGTPTIYWHDTFLSQLMPAKDPCRVTSRREMRKAIALMSDPDVSAEHAATQWKSLQTLFEGLQEKWEAILDL